MTFRQFTVFAEVAKQLNITKAAHTLHMSQPSLSKHLKTLEEDYRIKLFTRYAKGIRLTDEGHEFIRYIEPILAQFEKVNQRYQNGSSEKYTGTSRWEEPACSPWEFFHQCLLASKNHPKGNAVLR